MIHYINIILQEPPNTAVNKGKIFELGKKNWSSGFMTSLCSNLLTQLQKLARIIILNEASSDIFFQKANNKGADQTAH